MKIEFEDRKDVKMYVIYMLIVLLLIGERCWVVEDNSESGEGMLNRNITTTYACCIKVMWSMDIILV